MSDLGVEVLKKHGIFIHTAFFHKDESVLKNILRKTGGENIVGKKKCTLLKGEEQSLNILCLPHNPFTK
jgi:hypothetical protein